MPNYELIDRYSSITKFIKYSLIKKNIKRVIIFLKRIIIFSKGSSVWTTTLLPEYLQRKLFRLSY